MRLARPGAAARLDLLRLRAIPRPDRPRWLIASTRPTRRSGRRRPGSPFSAEIADEKRSARVSLLMTPKQAKTLCQQYQLAPSKIEGQHYWRLFASLELLASELLDPEAVPVKNLRRIQL